MTVENLKGQQNQCRGCGKYFARNSAFSKHRVGSFGKDRRCMTDEEMESKFRKCEDGFWRLLPREGRGVAWYAGKRETSAVG